MLPMRILSMCELQRIDGFKPGILVFSTTVVIEHNRSFTPLHEQESIMA
jgi:hypothetical protein